MVSAGAHYVRTTTRISLAIQALTGVIGALGLLVPYDPGHKILNQALTLEMVVQAIEFLFYTFFVTLLNLELLTSLRYFDWFLSTPTMLYTMAAYFIFESYREQQIETKEQITIEWVWKTYRNEIMIMLVANFLMLLLGLLGEYGILSRSTAFWTGTAAFLVSFSTLYKTFAANSKVATSIFIPVFAIWSGYGIAFLQDPITKNVAYNFLDIIAKNVFGLFLAYKLWVDQPTRGESSH